MGNRLSKIYTRTGDSGETGWATAAGRQGSPRVEAMGEVDTLNSQLGAACRAGRCAGAVAGAR